MRSPVQSMKHTRFLLGMIALIFVPSNPGCAKEWQSEKLNCAITFPEGWEEETFSNLNIKAGARSPDGLQVVRIVTDDKVYPGLKKVNTIFTFTLEKTLYRGGKRIAGRKLKVGGLPGYETQGKMLSDGKLISFVGRFVVAESKVYQIHALHTKEDATKSPEMAKALDSFRFLRIPQGEATSFSQGEMDPASIGYRVAKISAVVLPITGLFVMLLIVIAKAMRRKTPRPPPLPPLPPGF